MSLDIVLKLDRLLEARGYWRKHVTRGKEVKSAEEVRARAHLPVPPKKMSKADKALWDEWLKEKQAGKTDRPFKFWKADRSKK